MIPSGNAYNEDVQSEIRTEMNNDGKGLESKLDLDYGNNDWMYTHFFPKR